MVVPSLSLSDPLIYLRCFFFVSWVPWGTTRIKILKRNLVAQIYSVAATIHETPGNPCRVDVVPAYMLIAAIWNFSRDAFMPHFLFVNVYFSVYVIKRVVHFVFWPYGLCISLPR